MRAWLETYRSLLRCSGSIQCSIRSGTIRASKNSPPRPRRKNRKAQPRCSTKRSHARHKMKYWEIIADNLSKAGWSWGCISAVDSNRQTIWIVDAHRDDGKRFVMRADEKLTAFLEMETDNCRIACWFRDTGRYGSLKSPACSCVSITLPAAS